VRQDILVVLDSRNATSYYNGNFLSDVEWDLKNVLSKPKAGAEFSVNVVNASIPIGQYNVNSKNNILELKNTSTNVTNTITVPVGNYTITQLITVLNSLSAAEYDFTFVPLTNKIFIFHNLLAGQFQVLGTSTIWELLGFDRGVIQSSIAQVCNAPNCVNMSGLRNINIHMDNLVTKNITSFTKAESTIIASIPVDVNSSGVLSYNLSNNYDVPVPISTLDYIGILLKDDLGNFLENNGIHWAVTLKFSYLIERDFNTETLHDKTRNSKLSIYQPIKQQIIRNEIPEVFNSNPGNPVLQKTSPPEK
jgi:hypothetical protein